MAPNSMLGMENGPYRKFLDLIGLVLFPVPMLEFFCLTMEGAVCLALTLPGMRSKNSYIFRSTGPANVPLMNDWTPGTIL